MKNLFTSILCLLLCQFITAQTQGKIVYNETLKIEFAGMDEQMKDMLPASQSLKKELLFKGNETLYQNVRGESVEDLEMTSEDGSFQIKMMVDDTEDILFKYIAEKKTVHQKGLMGKSFVVSEALKTHKWKITNEKIKYLDYECQKAVIENEDSFVIAWFTSQLPTQAGPAGYHGLPGAILMISENDGKREMKALSIELKDIDQKEMKTPNKGKKVSESEFQEIQKAKLKEMEEMHGGHSVKIRN